MAEEQDKTVNRWQLPRMDARGATVMSYHRKPSEGDRHTKQAESQDMIKAVRDKAAQQGYQEGLEQAKQEYAARLQYLRELIEFFESPLQSVNEEIEQQLAHVAISIAQQLVRRELKTDPGEIIGLIRDSIKLLPGNARNIVIRLHPEDARMVREAFSIDAREDETGWKIAEDPAISRGGCEIKADPSEINLTLENRLSGLAASVLGGEREADL